jgi:hypothetical protein
MLTAIRDESPRLRYRPRLILSCSNHNIRSHTFIFGRQFIVQADQHCQPASSGSCAACCGGMQ